MKAIQAMSQADVAHERSQLEEECVALSRKIAELRARQARAQRTLNRINVQTALLGEREVPQYAPWLPFSSNGKN